MDERMARRRWGGSSLRSRCCESRDGGGCHVPRAWKFLTTPRYCSAAPDNIRVWWQSECEARELTADNLGNDRGLPLSRTSGGNEEVGGIVGLEHVLMRRSRDDLTGFLGSAMKPLIARGDTSDLFRSHNPKPRAALTLPHLRHRPSTTFTPTPQRKRTLRRPRARRATIRRLDKCGTSTRVRHLRARRGRMADEVG